MDELRKALGALYEEFGHNQVTLKLSELLDEYIVMQQKEKLKNEKMYF